MNRRSFLLSSLAATAAGPLSAMSSPLPSGAPPIAGEARVAVLLVDTDRATIPIDKRIYGQFLEHINHSVEDGLFAEQIRGAGFEGEDFNIYWEFFSARGRVEVAEIDFQNGKKSVRLHVDGGHAGIRQGRIFLDKGIKYDGSLWIKREKGSSKLTLHVTSSKGVPIASIPLTFAGSDWQEIPYSFTSSVRDTKL